jgi:uncharacterized protein YciI
MRIFLPIFLAVLMAAGQAVAQPQPAGGPAPSTYKSALPKQLHAWIMLIRLRYDLYARWKATGVWPNDPEANKALESHSAYWRDQLKQGHAVVAGGMGGDYWDNYAMIVFEAPTLKDAEAIVAADPAVRAFVFQAQVRPFDLLFLTNKYGAVDSDAPPDAHAPSKR